MKAINPEVWGPSGWSLLHRLSFCFDNKDNDTDSDNAEAFYNTLQYILPCPKCRRNLMEHYTKLPFPSSNKLKDLPEWLWKIHNRVTESLDREKGREREREREKGPSFSEIKNKYSKTCHSVDTCEFKFLLAIAETHPGGLSIYSDYYKALTVFLRIFINKSYNAKDKVKDKVIRPTGLPTSDILKSRYKFRKWVQKLTNTKEYFDKCAIVE